MLVDKLPSSSKLPAQLVCHWLNGSATLVLCNNVHKPPAEPFVAVINNDVPVKAMLVKRGDNGMAGGAKTAATKALAVGFELGGRGHEYEMVSIPALNPEM